MFTVFWCFSHLTLISLDGTDWSTRSCCVIPWTRIFFKELSKWDKWSKCCGIATLPARCVRLCSMPVHSKHLRAFFPSFIFHPLGQANAPPSQWSSFRQGLCHWVPRPQHANNVKTIWYIYIPTGSLKTVGQNDIRLFFTYTGETTLCRASGAELWDWKSKFSTTIGRHSTKANCWHYPLCCVTCYFKTTTTCHTLQCNYNVCNYPAPRHPPHPTPTQRARDMLLQNNHNVSHTSMQLQRL